jgi:hypothetical protein
MILVRGADYTLANNRGNNVIDMTIASEFLPGTPGWDQREKVIAFLESQGADFGPAERKLQMTWPEAYDRWMQQKRDRAAEPQRDVASP